MAKLTREQLNKWNEGAGQGFKLDLQEYFNWHEKNLEYMGEARADGTFFGVSFRYHDETIGEGWTAKKTGKQLLYLTVDRYIPGSVEGVYQLDRLFSEIVGDPQNKKMFSYMQKMSHEIDLQGYLARAEEMRPIDTPNKEPEPISLLDMIEEAAQEPETAQETPQEDTQPEGMETIEELSAQATENATESATEAETVQENTQPEETPQEAENATETATAGAMPDMFAELARAYFTGKSAKPTKKPAQAKEKPQAEDSTREAEKPTEKPQEPPKTEPGYFDNDNAAFTEEELSALANGGQIVREDRYSTYVYFTAQYSDSVRLVYKANANDNGVIKPGYGASNDGVIINGAYYSNFSPIAEKLENDINIRLKELLPDEKSAAHAAANVEEWERERISDAKATDYTQTALNYFYDGKEPEIILFWDAVTDKTELISYLLSPIDTIERLALAHMCNRASEIYRRYIAYDNTLAILNRVKNDPENEAHELLKIRQCITDQKTVRIELSNGHEVKAEADRVKWITSGGYISRYYVAANDRQFLPQNEYDRPDDIHLKDIVAIYHGGRTLYKTA